MSMRSICSMPVFSLFLFACSGQGQETTIGEIAVVDKFQTPDAPPTGTASTPPFNITCKAPLHDNGQGGCYYADPDPRRCVTNADCGLIAALPFCYNGICSVAECEGYICPEAFPHCAFKGECYNANVDPLNCGGSGKSCPTSAPDASCTQQSCSDKTSCRGSLCSEASCELMLCPSGKPNCQQGQCFNGLNDPKNCGQLGNQCPSFLPNCTLGACTK